MEGPCLLLRHDRAGDAVKSLPALRALKASAPHSELHVLVSTHNVSLFENEPGIRVHSLPAHWEKLKDPVLLSHLAHQGLPAAFSRVVNLLCDPFAESDRLLRLFPATEKYTAGVKDKSLLPEINLLRFPNQTPARRDETLNIALLLSQSFGIDLARAIGSFPAAPILTPEDLREAITLMGEKSGRWLGFCPITPVAKRSPVKRWEAFLSQATRTPLADKFFLFGTPSDIHALESLRARCYNPEKVQICFPSSFRTLGAYFQRLDGVVAADSGPLHLARSLKVRSLGIMRGGDAERWFADLHPEDRLLKKGLFSRFPSSLEMVWAFRGWLPSKV